MPTYEFVCEKCDKPFSVILSVSDFEKRKYRCPKCNGKKVRLQITAFETITSKKS
jgi:putative FmdB family regulatory protein